MKKMLSCDGLKKYLLLYMYVALVLLHVIFGVVSAITDALTMPPPKQLGFEDFTLHDLSINEDGTLTAIGSDPQLVYSGDPQQVRSIYYRLAQPSEGTVCLYYTQQQGQDYSNHMRLFPPFGRSDEALYILPRNAVNIRLDIGSVAGEVYDVRSITLNEPIPFWSYFSMTNREIVLAILLPLLLCSAVAMFTVRKDKTKG